MFWRWQQLVIRRKDFEVFAKAIEEIDRRESLKYKKGGGGRIIH